jgi:hypothetical protein
MEYLNIQENQSQFLFVMFKLCANKNHSYKHNWQINKQNIDNSECFGVKYVKIYPEMTDLFFAEIYRIIKVNFYLLCLNYIQIKITHNNIMSK